MKCKDCPYGKESLKKYADFMDESDAETCIWCDKIGGKVSLYGICSDHYEDEESSGRRSNKRKRNKRERYIKHQYHMKNLEMSSCGYPKSCIYTDEIWIRGQGYVENPKPYYKRIYRGKISKYLKKLSHRKVRRYKGDLSDGCGHHKLFDFWWELS